jgi:hypothetical protein
VVFKTDALDVDVGLVCTLLILFTGTCWSCFYWPGARKNYLREKKIHGLMEDETVESSATDMVAVFFDHLGGDCACQDRGNPN